MTTSCVFCRIADGTEPAIVYKRDTFFVAFGDKNSQDILVIPVVHTPPTIFELAKLQGQIFWFIDCLVAQMGFSACEIEIHLEYHISVEHLHIRIRRH